MNTETLIFCIACEGAALLVKFVIYLSCMLENWNAAW